MARCARLLAVSVCAASILGMSIPSNAEAGSDNNGAVSSVRIGLADLPDGYRVVSADELAQTDMADSFAGTASSGVFASADNSEVLLFGIGAVPDDARQEVVAGLADPERLFDLPWSASQTSEHDTRQLDVAGVGDAAGGVAIVDVAAENVTFRNLLGGEGTRAGSFVVFGLRDSYLFGAVVIHLGAGEPEIDAVATARLIDVRLAAALGIPIGAFRPEGTFSPEVAANIPSPGDISTEPKVIGANLVLAALAVLALTIGIRVLNTTLVAHEDALERLFTPARALGRWWSKADSTIARRRSRWADTVRAGGVLAFYGVLFSLLEPGWRPWTLAGLFVMVVMTIAFGVVGTCDDMMRWRTARRWNLPAGLVVKPALVMFAVGSVVLTKVAGLVPGLLIGTPEAFSMEEDVSARDESRLAAVGLGTTAAIGAAAWALSAPLDGMIDDGNGAAQKLLAALVSLLVLIFAVAVENLFANLLAVRGSEGAAIRNRSKAGWLAMMMVITALFFHTLINPRGDLAESLRTTNVRVVLATVGVFLIATVIIRSVFARRDRQVGPQPHDTTLLPPPTPIPVPLPTPMPTPMPMPMPSSRSARRAEQRGAQQPRHTARTIRRTVALLLVLALVGGIAVVIVQHRRDTDRYNSAHAAYLAGRCADAIADFDTLLDSTRLIDTTGTVTDAEAQRHECSDLLAVDALGATDPPAALAGYASFLTSWPDTPLRQIVAVHAAELVGNRGAAAVASTTTCTRLTEITAAGVIVPTTATEIRLECASLSQTAGRTADAYDAALEVLRNTTDPQLLDRATGILLTNTQACSNFDEIRTLAGLDQQPSALSAALQFCITTASDSGDVAVASELRLALLSTLPADAAAPAAAAALLASPEACGVLADAQADPAMVGQTQFLADFTLWCAQVAEYIGDFDAAVARYQWFLDHAPLDERAVSARDGLARSLIRQAEGAGAGELPEPQQSGGTGTGATTVTVYNDSPEELRLVLSGPESRIEIIPASPTSSTYSLVGPTVCRTDVPSLDLQLQPGEYRALVEATSGGVDDFVGTWNLAGGDAYESCFFVVTTFG